MALALVTGGAGFIGSHLVDALVARGDRVRVLDDFSTGRRENLESAASTGRLEIITGSVVDCDTARAAAAGCERIFHLAATVGVRRVLADPAGGLRNNILGTDSILRAAREVGPDSFVLFSSSEVYGRTVGGALSEEAISAIGPTAVPRWSYAAGKAVSEYLALGEYLRRRLPVTVVRCFNTCGPRQLGSYGMVVPNLLRQALAGEPMTVYGQGTQTRCFSFVGDVVRGVLALSEAPIPRGKVYNIGTDREVTIIELAESVRRVTNSRSEIRLVSYEEAYGQGFEDVPRRVPDLSKIRAAIGYEPQYDLDRLLTVTRDWVAGHVDLASPVA